MSAQFLPQSLSRSSAPFAERSSSWNDYRDKVRLCGYREWRRTSEIVLNGFPKAVGLSLKRVKTPKLNCRNNKPRRTEPLTATQKHSSEITCFSFICITSFSLHDEIKQLWTRHEKLKERRKNRWFRTPKSVLRRSEVATMLAQKLVLPVKSSVNCDAARRKRSIGPSRGMAGI